MPSTRIHLGVNVDHIATLRQARGTRYPDPVIAASLAELAGADQVTVHLREDRRHIQERDLEILRKTVQVPLNLEMAATPEMVALACKYMPDIVTLVPEKREERTTEGGLDCIGQEAAVHKAIEALRSAGIVVSLFIGPDEDQMRKAATLRAHTIELHTGEYCDAVGVLHQERELQRLHKACVTAHNLGLRVAAGHGLDYHNVRAICALPHVAELNIGHSLIARAVLVGLERAVREMIEVMRQS